MDEPEPPDDGATREIDPAQFRALLAHESARARQRSPTIPATGEQLRALVAQTADPDDDLAIPVEGSQAAKPHAIVVAETGARVAQDEIGGHPRHDEVGEHPRHDEVDDREVVLANLPRHVTPPAPGSHAARHVVLVVLAVAIAAALAFYQLG